MNQSKASARYYLFEDVLWETSAFAHLKKRRPMTELQLLAAFVWAREGGKAACPTVTARRQNDASHYYHPTRTIHLAPKHRGAGGLLHELAHALGTHDKLTHGPAFRDRCLRLYRMYGDWSGCVVGSDELWAAHQRKRKR